MPNRSLVILRAESALASSSSPSGTEAAHSAPLFPPRGMKYPHKCGNLPCCSTENRGAVTDRPGKAFILWKGAPRGSPAASSADSGHSPPLRLPSAWPHGLLRLHRPPEP